MSVHEKIRLMRELKRWSQEEMASRLNMSPNGYAKIERGETKLHLDKLSQIAKVLNIDVLELMTTDKGVVFFMQENGNNGCNNYYSPQHHYGDSAAEIEKLQLIIKHQKEMLEQKNNELVTLKKLLDFLETKQGLESN